MEGLVDDTGQKAGVSFSVWYFKLIIRILVRFDDLFRLPLCLLSLWISTADGGSTFLLHGFVVYIGSAFICHFIVQA